MLKQIYIKLKKNIFPTPAQAILSFLIALGIFFILKSFLEWAVFTAVWNADSVQACSAIDDGACWAFIKNRIDFILVGFYPSEERWRAWTALGLFFVGMIYSGRKKSWKLSLVFVWILLSISMLVLLNGFPLIGLEHVSSDAWGGLIVTIIIATNSIIFSYPLGILLALARRSKMPLIKGISVAYIELMRGVPFISLLFMTTLMLPLFLPAGFDIPKLTRAIIAAILFSGAYLAEVIRGGLASINRGQYEASDSLGLSYWKSITFIVLPQSLTKVIQPTVGSFIAVFIDTSLVVIISMYDLLGAGRAAASDIDWLGTGRELYVFLILIYFSFCYTLSKYSRKLEATISQKSH